MNKQATSKPRELEINCEMLIELYELINEKDYGNIREYHSDAIRNAVIGTGWYDNYQGLTPTEVCDD